MYTVTSKLQYDRTRQEYNALEFEQGKISRMLYTATQAVSAMEADCGGDKDKLKALKETDDYKTWHAYEVSLKGRADSIEVELSVLEEEMNTFKSERDKGIEKQTAFWCFK